MRRINEFSMDFLAKSNNEGFARSVVGVFASQLDPTVDEIADIKTAVSEAVTNCVVHAYSGKKYQNGENKIRIEITIEDYGRGIENVELARQAMYTTSPDTERSGLGFTIMESFTDKMDVVSRPDEGTKITMLKLIKNLQ